MKAESAGTISKKKIIIVGSVIVVLALGVYIGVSKYQEKQLIASMPESTDTFGDIEIIEEPVPLEDQDLTTTEEATEETTEPTEATEATEATEVTEATEATEPAEATEAPKPTEATKPATTQATTTKPAEAQLAAKPVRKGNISITKIAPRAQANVRSAFTNLGFIVNVKSNAGFTGRFNAKAREITLKRKDTNIYHELGHFVSFAAGNMDTSSAFKTAFKKEKKKYQGRNRKYILKNASEYFAESYREFVLQGKTLKKQRPKTYAVISTSVNKINNSQVKKLKRVYARAWN